MTEPSAQGSRRATRGSVSFLLLALLVACTGDAVAAGEFSASGSAGGAFTRSPGAGLSDLLSGPLPGTQAREDADLSARLERALLGFDGVEAVSVIVARPSDAPDAPPHVAVQLKLVAEFTPTPAWLNTVRVFSLRTIPHLDPSSLTIVDSRGQTLSEAGESRLPPMVAPEVGVVDETFRFDPWWLLAAAGAGFVLVIGGVAVQRSLRRNHGSDSEVEAAGPLDFLREAPEERVASVLAGERPEVIAAVIALAPSATARRLARRYEVPADLPHLSEPPDPALVAALARTLRERLMLS